MGKHKLKQKTVLVVIALFALLGECGGSDGNSKSAAERAGQETVVIKGYTLPPEPDPKINNSTLLGVDSNNNGVRDDVERWIYDRYDVYYPCEHTVQKIVLEGREKLMLSGKEVKQKVNLTCSETPVAYHPIVREIAMQFGRAAQIVIQEPEKARETMKYMHAAVDCNSYFQRSAKYQDEPILIDHYIFGDEFKNVQFNTAQRSRAFYEHNMVLSGGVYSSSITTADDRKSCDFNVTKLLEEGQ